MIYGIKTVAKYLLGIDKAGRNFKVFPDDTMLVSYPRSGNTWTRFLIAHLVFPDHAVSFTNIEALIPDTSSQSSHALKRVPRPRIIKTHEYFDHRYPRTLYIVRDPRDVALSYYNFQRKYRQIEDGYSLERFIEDFVSGRLISAPWGTWAENVGSWIHTRSGSSNFLLLRYEDMLEDTMGQLTRVADFLGVQHDPQRLQRAIEMSSASRMRQLEQQQHERWIATRKRRPDIPFVGNASSGGWRISLPSSSVGQIESAWGKLMLDLGYPLSVGNLSSEVPERAR